MSTVIDIVVVLDTKAVLSSYGTGGTSTAPKWIGHNYAYMIAQSAFVRSGQATGDLSVNAEVGDVIRWRLLSLTGDADQAAEIYDISRYSGVQVTATPQALLAHPLVPEPILVDGKNTTPPTYNAVKQDDYYLQATIVESGTENYSVYFYITERQGSTLVLKGYYAWDPQIVVS